MPEALTWGAIILASGSIVTIIKFWLDLGRQLETIKQANTVAALADAKAVLVGQQFADFKEKVALTYATAKSLTEVEQTFARGLERAVEGIYSRLDNVTNRLDSLVTMASRRDSGS